MLADDDAARSLINVPDHAGASPLILAMERAANRRWDLKYIRANDGKPMLDHMDCSLGACFSDYTEAIATLMKSKHLRLHGVFGVTESSIATSRSSPRPVQESSSSVMLSSWLESKSSRELNRFLKNPCRGLLALAEFSVNMIIMKTKSE